MLEIWIIRCSALVGRALVWWTGVMGRERVGDESLARRIEQARRDWS